MLLAEAGAYLAQGDVESCCHSLSEALNIARAISLPGKEQRVHVLYARCKSNAPDHMAVSRLEKQLAS